MVVFGTPTTAPQLYTASLDAVSEHVEGKASKLSANNL
jgi:hypothetical protein